MRTRPLIVLAALSLACLAGCKSGHGQYTKEAIEKSKERMAMLKAMNEYQQAYQSYAAGDLAKARKYVDNSITIHPSVAKSHVLRGRILLEQSDLEEASNSLLRAEAIAPTNVEAQYYLGIVYERFSQPENAVVRYRKAAELEPSNPQYAIATAETLIDLGEPEEAEKFLTERAAAFEHNAGARQTLGHIAMMRGDPERGRELFNEARLLAPDDTTVLEDLIRAEIATAKFADAEFNITRLMKAPGNAARRDLVLMRARCLLNLDRPVEAREALLKLTGDDAGQKDVESWVLLGNTSYMLRDMNRVRTAATRVIALAPARHEGYMLRALWQRKQGDLNAALESVDKAVERAGADVEPLLLQGVVLREMGRLDDAKGSFTAAVERDPSNRIARQALAAMQRTAAVSEQ